MPRRPLRIALIAAVLVAASAHAQDLTVFAASSLTEAFQDVAQAFEARNPGVRVVLNFAGSAALALQIDQGAPADVFASANPEQMQKVVDEGMVAGEPAPFAGNRLVIITPPDSLVRTPADLAAHGAKVVLAAPEVPVGNYAREALEKMNAVYGPDFARLAMANVVSEEPNVRQVAAKVELGEADAAVVYATDAAVTDGVRVLELPDGTNVAATYPIATLVDSSRPDLARAFVAFVLSDEGQALLASRGFRATP